MINKDPAYIHTLFLEAFNAGNIDSLVALYEPNAVLIQRFAICNGHEPFSEIAVYRCL